MAPNIVEVPASFHPIVVEPPKAKRKSHPFVGFIDFQGLEIDVENKAGDDRTGVDSTGTAWTTHMHHHYGEIRDTEGVDGDNLDVYVGPNHDSSLVVVIHQHRPATGVYDEDKVMLGFDSVEEAIGAYKKQYNQPGFFKEGDFQQMPIGQFWRWVHEEKNRGKKIKASTRLALRFLCGSESALDAPRSTKAKPGERVKLPGFNYILFTESFDSDDAFAPIVASFEVIDGWVYYRGKNGSEGIVVGTKAQLQGWANQVQLAQSQDTKKSREPLPWDPSMGGAKKIRDAKRVAEGVLRALGVHAEIRFWDTPSTDFKGGDATGEVVNLENVHKSNQKVKFLGVGVPAHLATAAHEAAHLGYHKGGAKVLAALKEYRKEGGESITLYHALAGDFEGVMEAAAMYVFAGRTLQEKAPSVYAAVSEWFGGRRVKVGANALVYMYKGERDPIWGEIEVALQKFNDLVRELQRLPRKNTLEYIRSNPRMQDVLDEFGFGDDGNPAGVSSPVGKWITRYWPDARPEFYKLRDDIRTPFFALAHDFKTRTEPYDGVPDEVWAQRLLDAVEKYTDVVNSYLAQAGDESFTYRGLLVKNPDRIPPVAMRELLGGVDYIVALFKKRGVEPLLLDSVKSLLIRERRADEGNALGWYISKRRQVQMLAPARLAQFPRMLKTWVQEVLLHEIGHHVHMSLLHPEAVKVWDAPWEAMEQTKKDLQKKEEELRSVTYEDRDKFWHLLLDVRGDLKKIRLTGIEKMKFHAWLSKPIMGDPYVTPKNLRWTERGKRLVDAILLDPNRLARIKENDLNPSDWQGVHPSLTDEAIAEYRTSDDSIDKAVAALQIPTDYGKTDLWEDFAETFVAFMDAPDRLSDVAKYRMQQALSISGLYGRKIMRVASSVKLNLQRYEKQLKDKLYDLVNYTVTQKERNRKQSGPDWSKIRDQVTQLLGPEIARKIDPSTTDWVRELSRQLLGLGHAHFDVTIPLFRQIEAWEDSIGPPPDFDAEWEDAQKDLHRITSATEDLARKLASTLDGAIRRIPAWGGSKIEIQPMMGDEWMNPAHSFSVEVGQEGASVTVFLSDSGQVEGIGDQLEGGDQDFFRSPESSVDYFGLVKELTNPGSSSKGKLKTLYTARPLRDRRRYETARSLPPGVFLSSQFHDAAGLAVDLGGSETRDVWRVVISDVYLVETLSMGSVKHYQVIGRHDAPVEKMSLVEEGAPLRAARRLAARYLQSNTPSPLATKLIAVMASGQGKTSTVNINVLEEALRLIGWGVRETTGATPLTEAVEYLVKPFVSKLPGFEYLGNPLTVSEPCEIHFQSEERAKEALQHLSRTMEPFTGKAPSNPQVGKIYFTTPAINTIRNHFGERWVLQLFRCSFGVTAWEFSTPKGKTVSVTPTVDFKGRPQEATALKLPKFWTWAYGEGLADDAKTYMNGGGAETLQRYREEKEQAIRSLENTGTCPACFRNVKLIRQLISRHGWEVQGGGWRNFGAFHTGSCFGTGYKPFEQSKEGTVDYKVQVDLSLDRMKAQLNELESGPVPFIYSPSGKKYTPENPLFQDFLVRAIRDRKRDIKEVQDLLRDLDSRITQWTQRPLPGTQRVASRVASRYLVSRHNWGRPDDGFWVQTLDSSGREKYRSWLDESFDSATQYALELSQKGSRVQLLDKDDEPVVGFVGGKAESGYWVETLGAGNRLMHRLWVAVFKYAQDFALEQSLLHGVARVVLRDKQEHPLKAYTRGAPLGARSARLLAHRWLAVVKTGTKSDADVEDEEAERLVRQDPKKKPPRSDLRRERMDLDKDSDLTPSGADKDKDLSLNYKKIASRWRQAMEDPEHHPGDVWETESGWRGMNSSGDAKTFPSQDEAKAFADGSDPEPDPDGPPDGPDSEDEDPAPEDDSAPEDEDPAPEDDSAPEDEEPPPPPPDHTQTENALKDLDKQEKGHDLASRFDDFSDEAKVRVAQAMNTKLRSLRAREVTSSLVQEVLDNIQNLQRSGLTSTAFGEAAAALKFAQEVLTNPSKVTPITSTPPSAAGLAKIPKTSFDHFSKLTPALRASSFRNIAKQLGDLTAGSAEHDQMSRVLDGLHLASLAAGDDAKVREVGGRRLLPEPSGMLKSLLKMQAEDGLDPTDLLNTDFYGPAGRTVLRQRMGQLEDSDLTELFADGDGEAAKELQAALKNAKHPWQREMIRNLMGEMTLDSMTVLHASITAQASADNDGGGGDDGGGPRARPETPEQLDDLVNELGGKARRAAREEWSAALDCINGHQGTRETLYDSCGDAYEKARLKLLSSFREMMEEDFGISDPLDPFLVQLQTAIERGDLSELDKKFRRENGGGAA